MNRTRSGGQSGGAVIIAMLTVALVTASATFLIRSQSLWVTQTTTALDFAQGHQVLLAGLDWSLSVLADDARSSRIDHQQEVWATRMAPSEADGWEIVGYVEDAQGRFNLNNLVQNGTVSAHDVEVFSRLLTEIGVDVRLARTLVDWMDEDSQTDVAGGAEDDVYLKRNPAYRAANRSLIELSNLSKVSGFDAQIIARLSPWVTVLPRATTVNANTAPAQVLVAVIPGLTRGEAELLANSRDTTPFNSLNELQSRLPRKDLKFEARDLSVSSNYFVVNGSARRGEIRMGMMSLVYRQGSSWPLIVWRREA